MQNVPDSIDSKFRLVLLAAERAEQLVRGAAARTALDEIYTDLVQWGYGPAPEPATKAASEPSADEGDAP